MTEAVQRHANTLSGASQKYTYICDSIVCFTPVLTFLVQYLLLLGADQ